MPKVVHFDLPADDTQRAIEFYSTVFGWTFDKWDGPMEYWLIDAGPDEEPGIHGGLAQRQDPDPGMPARCDKIYTLEEKQLKESR